MEHVWCAGKDGWYMASWMPERTYAKHLQMIGYTVQVCIAKPE